MNKKRIIVVIVVAIVIVIGVMFGTFLALSSNDRIDDVVEKESNQVSDSLTDDNGDNTDNEVLEGNQDIEVDTDTVVDGSVNNSTDNQNGGATTDSFSGNTFNNNKDKDKTNSSAGSDSNTTNNIGNSEIADNSTNNEEINETLVIDNDNLILTCDSSYISKSKAVNCSLVGKVDGYKVSALSAVIDDTNLNIDKVVTDKIWQGDGEYGRIDLYTDVDKEKKFNIVTFIVQLKDEYSSDRVKLTVKDVVFYDEEFQAHSIDILSCELEVR